MLRYTQRGDSMDLEKVYNYQAYDIYQLYTQKVMRKGQKVEDLNTILSWLTGYTFEQMGNLFSKGVNLRDFIVGADGFNPNASLIKGVICGVRVEEIEDPIYQKIRYMDKIVDELAKGRAINKIMRGIQ